MTQPLVAFDDGGVLSMALARERGDAPAWAPFLFEMGGLRWEIHGSDSGGQRVLADVSGFPQCATELDRRGVLCVDQSVNGSTLWLAPSAKALSRVAVLPAVFDVVHAGGSDVIAAAERTGKRAAVVDVESRRGFQVSLPGGPARDGVRWKADVLSRGGHLFVLANAGDAAIVTRYSIR